MTDYKHFSGRICCSVFKIWSDLANYLVTWITRHHFSSMNDSYKSCESGRKSEFIRGMDTKGVGSDKQVKGVLNLEHPRRKISPPEICWLGAKVIYIFNFLSLPISGSGLQHRHRKSLLSLYVLTSPESVRHAEWKQPKNGNTQDMAKSWIYLCAV